MGYSVNLNGTSDQNALKFLLVLSSDHITGATGKTPTVTIQKAGGGFITPSGVVSELANGWYQVAAHPTDTDTLGPLLLHATGAACDPRDDTFYVANYNPANVLPIAPPTFATFGTVTARDIIKRAFDDIGAGQEGEPLSAAMAIDGLHRLNNMIASWALQPDTMLSLKREVFDMFADIPSYTIGPGGDFDTVRPVYLLGVSLLLTDGPPPIEIPLSPMNQQAYQVETIKGQTSTQPSAFYYAATQPLGTLYPWPIATSAANDLVIYSQEAVSGFATLSTPYTFAPGYTEAIEYNLAKRLSTPYGRPLPPEIRELAAQSLSWVKTANTKIVDMNLDPALTWGTQAPWNILSDR
jgi:hypothetical protein